MRTLWEQRASTILYKLFRSLDPAGVVLIPASVCPIVPVTLAKAGLRFELVDICPRSLCMDGELLQQKLRGATENYSAILYVHSYGVEDCFEALFQSLKLLAPGALLIDDRCLCRQTFDADEETSADVVLFSSGYSKYVEMGFGGYAFVKENVGYADIPLAFSQEDHDQLVEAMRSAQEGKQSFGYRESDWLDGSIPPVSFAEHKERLAAKLPQVKRHKEELNSIYRQGIPKEFQMGEDFHNWRFNILVPRKELLLQAIFEHGLFASSHYPSLNGVFGAGPDSLASALHSSVVNLFNNDRFTPDQAERAVEIVNVHLKAHGQEPSAFAKYWQERQ